MTDDLSPGVWPIVRSRGDGFTPTGAHDAYKKGDQVAHKGTTYRCITGHTSMVGWEPDQVPALWARV